MKVFVISVLFVLFDLVITQQAVPCIPSACQLPNCRCSTPDIPGGLTRSETPQFVLLTFDDAVTSLNAVYYRTALYNRFNPNGCRLGATFFLSHEYTNYEVVHELHSNGFEIACHSITHTSNQSYWSTASIATLRAELSDQKLLMERFANIPAEDIKGIRLPFLQMAGNTGFQLMATDGFTYDLSWPTESFMTSGMWPYTLNYASTQDCPIPPCPTASIPGPWVIPMINWRDDNGFICNMVDACTGVPTTRRGLLEFFKRQFRRHYESNKSPFGFHVHSAWFITHPKGLNAFMDLLDYLNTLPDVYIVNAKKVIEWVQKPVPLSSLNTATWSNCSAIAPQPCDGRTCQLTAPDGKPSSYTYYIQGHTVIRLLRTSSN